MSSPLKGFRMAARPFQRTAGKQLGSRSACDFVTEA